MSVRTLERQTPLAMTAGWYDVGAAADIPLRGARLVKTPQGCLAVFRTDDKTVFALEDRCPHKGGPLSQGIVHGTHVTCPLHNWVIDLNTGKAQGPDEGSVPTIPAEVRDGRVFLFLSDRSSGRHV
jgi:nitrite reductase (NADH) small subunit